MSNDAAGGWPIADTGDYDDVICPKCFGDPAGDSCECVPLDDAYPEDIQENT